MDEEDSRALKTLSEGQEDKASKKQNLDEEVEDLKKHLMIVSNDDDDVYTEATPLALKVPVVDYEIYTENNKPYYKIKRADGSHQLYLSFLSMLRNFDREDLELQGYFTLLFYYKSHNIEHLIKSEPYAAKGFKQIIDFLSGSYIHYALTMNPYIYISCIMQFWNTASVKRSDDVTRLQALVDKKKIVILEAVIREILQLDDAEGVVCLPNEEIFAGLAQMGYEKPSTKLNFYKAFFSSQWKFLIHTLLQSLSAKRTSWNEFSTAMASANQVGDLSTHTTRFISPALTQKVFANMRRVRKGFFGVETPLFEGMLAARQPAEEGLADEQVQVDAAVAAAVQENVAEDGEQFPTHIQQILDICSALTRRVENLENDKAAQKLEILKLKARVKRLEKANKVKSSKLRHLRKVGESRRVESSDDIEDVFNQGRMIDDLDKDEGIELDDSEVQEVVETVTTAKLITDVVTAASQVSAASVTISAAKPSIPATAPIVVDAYTRRRKGVIIRDPEEELSSKTPAETPKVRDKGKGILVETPKPIKKKDQIELDAEYARKLHEEINKDHEEFNKDIDWDAAMEHVNKKIQESSKNTVGYKMNFFKGMTYADICLIFQASINDTPAHKAAKRRKLSEEAQEAKDLRKHLEVVDDEDDDVFIEATPLARKVHVVDYQIVLVDNKPRFKIIKADETHQFYISFITLLKNFDREYLENLWGIVKERFYTSKPTNFSDEYLLLTLKTMFKKPDEQDDVWKNQSSVHGLALLILLVERRYPLSRFTLEQLVNVTRLQVEEESEMSLELLRFTRQQLQEYQQG
nr:hypothetical protein [Tanacetum cinerariifolium]